MAPDWGSTNWDLACPSIQCKPDSLGAQVYHFDDVSMDVLANSHQDAKQTLVEWIQRDLARLLKEGEFLRSLAIDIELRRSQLKRYLR